MLNFVSHVLEVVIALAMVTLAFGFPDADPTSTLPNNEPPTTERRSHHT